MTCQGICDEYGFACCFECKEQIDCANEFKCVDLYHYKMCRRHNETSED